MGLLRRRRLLHSASGGQNAGPSGADFSHLYAGGGAGAVCFCWSGPVLAIAALSLSAIGFLSVQPIFWTFPAQIVSGSALAASIGFCTTMGAFCSFLAPLIRVEVDAFFGNDSAGLVALSLITVCCALLIAALAGRKATNSVAVPITKS